MNEVIWYNKRIKKTNKLNIPFVGISDAAMNFIYSSIKDSYAEKYDSLNWKGIAEQCLAEFLDLV
jgi:hypothetical protein